MPYYLGLDGGGSKTTGALGDESRVLATVTTGPSNIVRVGEAQTRESLHQAVRQACAGAGIAPAEITRTCFGGAGVARPEIAETLRRILTEVLPTPITVVSDMEIALEAAFDAAPGVIVNAGTGSFAYGRNAQGQTARVGGLGFAIGDEGSAHWIGREAVRAVLRLADRTAGRTPSFRHTQLVAALCQAWDVTSLSDLASVANSIPPPNFASLFPAVAASRDLVAQEVQTAAGAELAQAAAVVIRRLFPVEAEEQIHTVPIAMIGSVFAHAPLVRGVFDSDLHELDRRVQLQPQVIDPVEGALRLARRA